MKKPEEIKLGLCEPLPVHFHKRNPEPRLTPLAYIALEKLLADALTYIQQLEQDNAKKDERIRRIGKSLFKAVIQLKQFACLTCDYSDMKHLARVCSTCENRNKWSWRGVEEDDHATD